MQLASSAAAAAARGARRRAPLAPPCPAAPSQPARLLRTAFFGTDDVSLASLRKLHESLTGGGPHAGLITSLDVVCPGPRPSGRGQRVADVPVGAFAREAGLRAVHVPFGLKSLKAWQGLDALRGEGGAAAQHTHDVAVVVSFGYFMPPHILDAMAQGAVNVHPSLLPRYRGAAPVEHTLLNGDAVTGVSIIELHRGKFDAGAVLDQVTTPVRPGETCSALTPRLAALGAERLMAVLADYPAARAAARPQAEEGATRAPKLFPEAGLVRWDDPAASSVGGLLRRHAAFDAAFGVYSHFTFGKPAGAPKRVRLVELGPAPADAPALRQFTAEGAGADGPTPLPPPGTLLWDRPTSTLLLRASDGWLGVGRLHIEHKTPVGGRDFANGFKIGATPAPGVALQLVASASSSSSGGGGAPAAAGGGAPAAAAGA